ncbi:uncharacterized protein LOC142350867 [Convolutriloba macropyga]|uniref:uncharacterized protein LOC142350867 n=1 Tax=Convolutriloba macropyga TaxID=536237 RepID=UPI003F51B1CB
MASQGTNLPDFMALFKIYDKDNSGYITEDEIREVLKSLEETKTDEEITELFKAMDRDGDGRISYQDFYNAMMADDDNEDD